MILEATRREKEISRRAVAASLQTGREGISKLELVSFPSGDLLVCEHLSRLSARCC